MQSCKQRPWAQKKGEGGGLLGKTIKSCTNKTVISPLGRFEFGVPIGPWSLSAAESGKMRTHEFGDDFLLEYLR